MKQPFISILVPVYNAEKYLKECLDSIASQSYRNWEAILVNDASTDGSLAICREYEAGDSRFHVVNLEKNGGLVNARKVLISHAKGDYVLWVDSDDCLGAERLALLVHPVEEYDVDAVVSGYTRCYDSNGKRVQVMDSYAPGFYDEGRWGDEKQLFFGFDKKKGNRRISTNVWSKIWRRELYLKHIFDVPSELKIGEDAIQTYSTLIEAAKIAVVEDYSYFYRITPTQMTAFKYYSGYYENALALYLTLRKWYPETAEKLAIDENIVHVSAFAVMNEGLNKNKADRKSNIRLITENHDTQNAIYKDSLSGQNAFYRMTARAIKAKAYGRLNFFAGAYRLFTRIASHF